MSREDFLNSAELSSESTGTKRLWASSDIGRETKRLCTQPNSLPSGSTSCWSGNENISWEGIDISPTTHFGNAAMQYCVDFQTEWSKTIPPGLFDGLDLTSNSLALGPNPLPINSVPILFHEVDMSNNLEANIYYPQPEIQENTNTFDLGYSFNTYSPNINHTDSILESWVLPDIGYSSFGEPLTGYTPAWTDVITNPGNVNGYQPVENLMSYETKTIEVASKIEEPLFISPGETKVVAQEDQSGLHNYSQSTMLSELEPKSFAFDANQIDICFGLIIAETTSSWTGSQETRATPVILSPFGDIMKLSFQDSKKYAGILALPVLCKLQEEFTIEYTAQIVVLESRKSQRNKTATSTLSNPTNNCSVRIVVYGVKSEKGSVSQLLSEAGLFLQHPSAAEFDEHVDYWNPHYLLRPGSEMPKLENLSLSLDVNNVSTTDLMDESQKSRFMQIFNFADGPSILSTPTSSPRLRSILNDHQVTALAMMIEKECGITENAQFPSLWDLSNSSGSAKQYRHKITGTCQASPIPFYGGILADEMGLGKTLSVLALVCASLDQLANQEGSLNDGMSRATLIVTPKSTIPGWEQQVERHIHANQMRLATYHGSNKRSLLSKLGETDIVLTTYETLRLDWAAKGPLYSATWRRVVLDEAHHIRNRSSKLFKAASDISSKSRWCLTGTPIHNSLDDYGALLSFIGVPLLTEKSQFDFWIALPIKQKRLSTFKTLGDLIRATCLRRTKDTIQDALNLPRKVKRTEKVKLHQADQVLYNFFKDKTAKIAAGLTSHDGSISKRSGKKGANILTLINFLRYICNHGEEMLPQSALEAWRSKNSMSVDWQMMRDCNKTCDFCESIINEIDSLSDDNLEFECHHSICTLCSMQHESTLVDEVRTCPKCAAAQVISRNSCNLPGLSSRLSAKVEVLMRNLSAEQHNSERHEGKTLPVKSVIFSQWTKMLDLIAKALTQHGFHFQRIDGQSSLQQRHIAIWKFNEDAACTVMLASIGSAGEGVDFTIANHVHIVEPHWSPMAEAQAIDRVHRIGQTREVSITRYIATNTIEEYIQWIQQEKLSLINRSLDSAEILQSDIDKTRWKALQKVLNASS